MPKNEVCGVSMQEIIVMVLFTHLVVWFLDPPGCVPFLERWSLERWLVIVPVSLRSCYEPRIANPSNREVPTSLLKTHFIQFTLFQKCEHQYHDRFYTTDSTQTGFEASFEKPKLAGPVTPKF